MATTKSTFLTQSGSLRRRDFSIPLHLCVKEYATHFISRFSLFSAITPFFRLLFLLLRSLWTYNHNTPTRSVVRHPSTTLVNFCGQHFLRHRRIITPDDGRGNGATPHGPSHHDLVASNRIPLGSHTGPVEPLQNGRYT